MKSFSKPVSKPRPGSGLSAQRAEFRTSFILLAFLFVVGTAFGAPTEKVGQRPYEMDWAHRTQDHCPPLVDFENLAGWRVESKGAVATFERSREQQLWGDHVGKLTYRGTTNAPQIRLLPPQPIAIAAPFDAVTLWCYGNNWGYARDTSTPPVNLSALFEDTAGKEFAVPLYSVNWKEWYLLHKRLGPEEIARIKSGAKFKGLLITGGRNKEDRVLYFDNLAVFTEQFPPLKFDPRPARGIAMFSGQSSGANTGPGTLPFPTRPETILPSNLTTRFKTSLTQDGAAFVFTYAGDDGTLRYQLNPKSGTWSDLTATWSPTKQSGGSTTITLQPCVEGGVYLQTAKTAVLPDKAQHLRTERQGDTVESRWRVSAADVSTEVTYTYRLWNKSLVVDVTARGGTVGEVRCGRATGLTNPRLVTNPFYPAEGGRPAVAVSGPPDAPLFVTGNADWYRSNGSILWAANSISTNGVTYNGGTRYLPLTSGKRNDCYERFFITVSPRYEEVLPNIPNPMSPWKQVTGTRVWRAYGAGNREHDKQYWTEVHRWGMTQLAITDHETMWRDGGESFTFRTKAAPGKGGDKGAQDYSRFMQDTLGFVYGPYNNYTDFAPVNEFWSFDMVGRTPDNQLQHAWMRCYAPKPARAIEYCAKLAPQMQEKFKFSTAYCDVHTAVAPWHRTDYDARVPGAGTFAAVFYSYGEIMLHQKKAWHGPVYSEGNYHSFYMGLTDGNYGQDQRYRPAENPWLVDFDLRKMHDLGCNFGMGNPGMFYANVSQPMGTVEERDAWLDRFLTATVAFGHPGFLVMDGGMANGLRSYYLLQQLHSRYCLASAQDIRYATGDGRLLETSPAIASGAHQRSQVVTRYSDGTVTAANGSKTERLKVRAFGRDLDLPPNGYAGWTGDGAIEVLSSDSNGHRSDYAVTPAYLYVDGRGKFMRFARAAGNGIGICRILPKGGHEILLHNNADCGFSVNAASAVALDKERKDLGPAELRTARGLTYVVPVKGAFSYRLTGSQARQSAALTSDRAEVFAGERVQVRGQQTHAVEIPKHAKPGERIWIQQEGAWIDFTVVPMADLETVLTGNTLRVRLTSNAPDAATFAVSAGKQTQSVRLAPRKAGEAAFDLSAPRQESADVLAVEVRLGATSQRLEYGLRAASETTQLLPLPEQWSKGARLRGQPEQADLSATLAHVYAGSSECAGVAKTGLAVHPPYQGGVGYAFARYDGLDLPAAPPAAFRASVGKRDGSDLGDGILYQLAVMDERGAETLVAEKTVLKHAWLPIEADLSRWAGKRVALKLIADVGPKNNSSGDWACWADMRIESLRPQLRYALDASVEPCRHVPGPHPVKGVTIEDLRKARSGRLHYDGKGLSGTGHYGTFVVLNGAELGNLAPAGGSETKGIFQENVSVPLNAEAIRSLGRRNRVAIRNPNGDSYSIRRFRIELDLADGRKCSSDISTATYTQPPAWPYAEGIRVPQDQDLAVEVWFEVQPTER